MEIKKAYRSLYVITLFILLGSQSLHAVSDTLIFQNGNMIVGEVKSMVKGVLEVDTDYGNANFKIDWLDIKEIYTESQFLVYAQSRSYVGRVATLPGKKIKVFDQDSLYLVCGHEEVVYLTQVKKKFSDRFNASIEFGFSLARAQNLRQLTTRSTLSYRADRWFVEGAFNYLRSLQDNADLIERSDSRINYRYILAKEWYITTVLSTLSNTEQKIDLRANSQVAFGNYVYTTNKAYWGLALGVNNNFERFSNETDGQNSWEAVFETDLNIYDIGDIDLILLAKSYLGLSDLSRFRSDITFDFKYDLKFDLYLKLGVSLNYDNQPAENASETDYVIRTTIGWKW